MINSILKYFVKSELAQWETSKKNAHNIQAKTFQTLINKGQESDFGRAHEYDKIKTHADLCARVPLRDYDDYHNYIERIKTGENHVLYPGKPRFFAKSSGTISHIKYLPVSAESAKTYTKAGLRMLAVYAQHKNDYQILLRHKLFVQGSPALTDLGGIPAGRMSGISYHLIPTILKSFQSPSYAVNTEEDWEIKVKKIAQETIDKDLRILAGIPPWVMMYMDEVLDLAKKSTFLKVFPNLSLYIHGGVNFEPYKDMVFEKIGKKIDSLDTYTASEGFFGFQEHVEDRAMTLITDNGVFYEFIPIHEVNSEHPTRLTLDQVQTGQDYALVLNTMSGLWGYIIGDTIRFTETLPYRFVVTGRVQEYTSLFGEHIIEQEVRKAMQEAITQFDLQIKYFTVAPKLLPEQGASHHEWWVEFERGPYQLDKIADTINQSLCNQNPYYKDLIDGKILSKARIVPVSKNGFTQSIAASGKMDGQNKVSLLTNHRNFVETLQPYRLAEAF